MTDLILAVGVFLVTHLVPAIRSVRAGLVRWMGEPVYLVAYSIASIAVIVWMVRAYSAAPYVELWPTVDWMRFVAVGGMAVACVLIVAGMATPNPFSLGWGRRGFDASRPGIVGVTRHPAIWGLGIWAGVHVLVNGNQASVILFGLLGVLSLAGPVSLEAKRRRELGPDVLKAMKTTIAKTGVGAALGQAGPLRIGGGLVLWAALWAVHEWAFGVAPVVL
ncbi:MAG: NnrU family protein [Alphaproteobacteria bacterium]|jgi:uncharacterized membrane protein|nr:NnrU family protein [Alphaproteobacteria bacterium]MBT7943023.1 NnrU family protein [Alphaproteobacteria bacterium]